MKVVTILRVTLQILFGIYFLYEVGHSISEYSKFQVLQIRTRLKDDTGIFPSVTVCPMRRGTENEVSFRVFVLREMSD